MILILGILLSYSRAGWLSLVGVIGIFLVLKLKINYKIVLSAGLILIVAFFAFRTQIIMELEKNKQDSSGKYAEHIRSISNISTDASNLERINRWAAAIRMFREKPVFGWGPGTYQLVYAPFQYSKEKTVISTNAGDLGNAHSEYIGPLSESGVLGLISVLLLFGSVVVTGVRVYKKALNTEVRLITLGALLGLCSYYIHGIMNNFLDTDKASVPFWAFTAIILVMDVYFKDKPQEIDPL
jgi:putative inorganic carbon (hco3(-)) transporter